MYKCLFVFVSSLLCTSVIAATCPTFYTMANDVQSETFMASINNTCTESSYYVINVSDNLIPLFTGFLSGNEKILCGDEYTSNGTTCTQYSQDDCPHNYVNTTLSNTTFTNTSMGTCGSGWSLYTVDEQCTTNPSNSICAALCQDDLKYTDVGTCALLCASGIQKLNIKKESGDVLSFPLYSELQTTPSIVVSYNDEQCFINLMSGNSVNTINIRNGNQKYHFVR